MSHRRGSAGSLRVVHLPWDGVNPYQERLSAALRANGVESIEGRSHRAFFFVNATKWKADVLHIHWPDALILNDSLPLSLLKSASFLLQLALCRLGGARVVWTAHDSRSLDGRHPRLEASVMGAFVRLCSAVIAHGPFAAAALVDEYPALADGRVAVIPHGPFDALPERISAREARAALSIPERSFVFLCFGQLRRYKGTDLLVEAFKSLEAPRPAVLLIAGAPRDRAYAAELTQACYGTASIRFEARLIEPPAVEALFAAADAVVMPYRAGSTSGVAAMAAGRSLPCLVSRSVAALDAFGEEGASYIPELSVEGLRQALRGMIESGAPPRPKLRAVLGWDEVARRTAEVYFRAAS